LSAATTELITRAVIRRDGWVLTVREHAESWFFLPGGHVEPGERVEAALARDLHEELGTDAELTRFLGAVEHGYTLNGVTRHELNLVFETTITAAEPTSQEEHIRADWLPLDRLDETDIRPGTMKNFLSGDAPSPWWIGLGR